MGGTLTIQNKVEITGNNLMENGGGIYAAGTVTLQGDVKITNNTATNGGGIYIAGGDVTIQGNVEITGNTATGAGDTGLGGGVYNAGAFTMNGGAIHGNSAQNAAADFYNSSDGTFTLFQAEGCSWYEDGPGQRYAAGHWNPYQIPENGVEVTGEKHLAAVQLEWEDTEERRY